MPEIHTKNTSVLLSGDLSDRAKHLIESGCLDSAKSMLCSALIISPGRPALINLLGTIFEREGDDESAALCFRGVLPDSANEKYFQADQISRLVLPARDCHDVDLLPATAAETTDLQTPVRYPEGGHYGQFNYRQTEARATFTTVATGGSVWFDGFNTLALDNKGQVLQEHVKGNEYAAYAAASTEQSVVLEGTACFIDDRSSGIYYHWMLDILPKLFVLQQSGIRLSDIDHFVVHLRSDFQKQSLIKCGVPEEKLLVIDGPVQFVRADRMIVPYLRNDLGARVYRGLGVGLATWIPEYLREIFLVDPVPQSGRRIYISRAARGSRNIRGESALKEQLARRGFETVEFENYPISEQAELMAQCEIVIGVHGAGLTNICFCHSNTKIVEIFGNYIVPCYWSLSEINSLSYAQYMASSAEPEGDKAGHRIDELRAMELLLDVDEFVAWVDTLL